MFHRIILVVGVGLLAACGAGGRPAVDDLQAALTSDDSLFPVAEQSATCAAETLIDSDLSDEALRALADADTSYTFADDDVQTLSQTQVEILSSCVG